MSPILKKAIAVSFSVFVLCVAYYGSYLPMRKSVVFIDAMQTTQSMKTIADFETGFSIPLGYSSPIGQEELVRSMANTVLSSLQRVSDPRGVQEMIRFVEQQYAPIMERKRGMSFGQNLYLLGILNEYTFERTEQPQYLEASEKYFKEAVTLGPKRPQGLYGLLDVYRLKGDFAAAKAIAEQIVSQWPADTKTKDALNQIIASTTVSGAKKP